METVKKLIRDVPDFPKEGIIFKDITPVLGEADAFARVIEVLADRYAGQGITQVVGIESRGFIFGTPLALKLGAGFVPVRKPGKLPCATFSASYALEYGVDAVHVHQDALGEKDKVVIIDDLLATGGTLAATVEVVQKTGAVVAEAAVVIELGFLEGRKKLEGAGTPVHALLTY